MLQISCRFAFFINFWSFKPDTENIREATTFDAYRILQYVSW